MEQRHKRKIVANVDKLSSLPNELLFHIFSFIDSKYAVQSSVLSSRWKRFWLYLPHLNFDSSLFQTVADFEKFVIHLLAHRSYHAEISTFKFVSRPIRVHLLKWMVRYVLSNKAQQLHIETTAYPTNDSDVPPSILNSECLKKLIINRQVIRFPITGCNVPAITSLNLENIRFSSGQGSDQSIGPFRQLLNLKSLTLTDCYYAELENFNISSHGLERLAIYQKHPLEITFGISTPNLLSFTCTSRHPLSLSWSDHGPLCLEKVEIDIVQNPSGLSMIRREQMIFQERIAREMISMFHQIPKTMSLMLSFNTLKLLSLAPRLLEGQPSPFVDLKYLKLSRGEFSRVSTVTQLAKDYLLNKSPSVTICIEPECNCE